jgi:CxxC-x17-CxxC domain-containing protein
MFPSNTIFFAKTNSRGEERVFGIKADDRRRHMYVMGKTGMGKTNLLETMAIQDIRNGHGMAYIDPHGDTAEKLLAAIPTRRMNDVIYFNPPDLERPIGFNVMEVGDPDTKHLIASGIVGVFHKLWANSWGVRLENTLRHAVLSLLAYPDATLLGVLKILMDEKYRKAVIKNEQDPIIRMFWERQFEKYSDRFRAEVIEPVQNKVSQFSTNPLIRNIIGQSKSAFDVRDVMDNGKILIMNLAKGRMGEDNTALLGALMITKIQLAGMTRADIPEENRKDFYLYVDEFQNFATESFATILSEARKYRLNLTLAHQYIEQLDEQVQSAVFGNVGTLVMFQMGARDAEVLEKEVRPTIDSYDLVNLPKYHVYLRLMIDGIATEPFSAVTLPPISLEQTKKNAGKVRSISRERYGTPRKLVEEKIWRWAGLLAGEVVKHEKARKRSAERGNQENHKKRLSFNAHCTTCGSVISLPFKPDGKRPTFCRGCLKDHQRKQAKTKQAQNG